MSKQIRLELTPTYKTNFLLSEMEPDNFSYNKDDEDEIGDYWKNWNKQWKD